MLQQHHNSTMTTESISSNDYTSTSTPLVSFTASPDGPKCPFSNPISFKLRPGACVRLSGSSGAGKTTLSMYLAGLQSESTLHKLDIQATCEWNPSIPPQERCGVLFQQTTLLDELTVAGNVSVALEARNHNHNVHSKQHLQDIKQLLESVGLDYARDGSKRPRCVDCIERTADQVPLL